MRHTLCCFANCTGHRLCVIIDFGDSFLYGWGLCSRRCKILDLFCYYYPLLQCRLYDTAECCTGRLYCSVMILRMYAIDSIAILSVYDDEDDVSILHNTV
jgi:hypothetical protein